MLGTVSLTMLYYLKLLTLKSRLDKFWQRQDMIYDLLAELRRIGSRSLHNN